MPCHALTTVAKTHENACQEKRKKIPEFRTFFYRVPTSRGLTPLAEMWWEARSNGETTCRPAGRSPTTSLGHGSALQTAERTRPAGRQIVSPHGTPHALAHLIRCRGPIRPQLVSCVGADWCARSIACRHTPCAADGYARRHLGGGGCSAKPCEGRRLGLLTAREARGPRARTKCEVSVLASPGP